MSQFMFQVGGRYEHDFSGMAADAQEIFRINGIHDKFVKIQTDFLYRFQRKNTSGDNHPLCFFERRIAVCARSIDERNISKMGTGFVIVDNTDIVFECGSGKSAVLFHCQQVSISVVEGEHRCGIECFADTGVFPLA